VGILRNHCGHSGKPPKSIRQSGKKPRSPWDNVGIHQNHCGNVGKSQKYYTIWVKFPNLLGPLKKIPEITGAMWKNPRISKSQNY